MVTSSHSDCFRIAQNIDHRKAAAGELGSSAKFGGRKAFRSKKDIKFISDLYRRKEE